MGVFKLTKRKFGLGLSLVLAAGTILGACGSKDEETKKTKVLMLVLELKKQQTSQSQWLQTSVE